MVRPSITGETIVVQVDKDLLTWTDGKLSGTNPEIVKAAKWLSDYGILVDLTPWGPSVEAGLDRADKPEQALAAMLGAVPGRGRILEASEELISLLPLYTDEDDEESDENYIN